jgi:drug/metabolite transporter (DMT)-like permease
MITAALSWAAATVLTKIVLRDLTAIDLLGVELSSSALTVGALLVLRRERLQLRRDGVFVGLGAIEPALSFALFDFGLARTGAADGAILIASESVFGVVLARVLLGERVGRKVGAAVVSGFVGSALVGLSEAGHGATLLGDILVLAASACAALYGVGTRRFARDGETLAATALQLIAAAVLALPLTLGEAISGSSHLLTADAWYVAAAVVVGLLGRVVPFLAFNGAIREMSVASAGLVLNLIPVVAVGLAVALLGERLGWAEIAGGALVILAASTGSARQT